jgi:hypothetical protein
MAIRFEIPSNLERVLRKQLDDLDQIAKEFALVGFYRQGRITHLDLSEALGLDRFQTEDVLHRHHVTEDLPTTEEVLADVQTLKDLRESP